jgi:glycosyltransferase involved in cell wall biosynthesis
VDQARQLLPGAHFVSADARALPFATDRFAVARLLNVLQDLSPVDGARVLADCHRVLAPGGLMLIYGLRMPNPFNTHTRRVARHDEGLPAESRTITLAAPIARRLGRAAPVLYPALARVPVLRSHRLWSYRKPVTMEEVGRSSVRIAFVSHYFHPEVGAAQTRILETARLLRARGHRVTVLTGMPNYPDGIIPAPYRRRVRMIESLEGVRVVRTAVYPAPNRGFGRRLLNHASFAVTSILGACAVGKVDVVVAETPPLFSAVASVPIARMLGARLLLNVADLWPESAVQLGMLKNRRAIQLAEALERFAYDHADTVTVPTPGMRTILFGRGYGVNKVKLLPNAVDVDRFAVVPPPGGERRRALYCGTVGLAQGVGTLLEAARLLEEQDSSVELEIVGDGAERDALEAWTQRAGLTRVRFVGRVSREEVPRRVAAADITVMTLRDVPLFEDALPTKLLEYMAAGRPVVASATGQAARMVEEVGAGIPCPPEDPTALAAAINRLAEDKELAWAMGRRGRQHVEERLSRRTMVEQLEREVQVLAAARE